VPVSEVAKTATWTHGHAASRGFLTLLSDGERLTGAYALGPGAGEWLQQATLAVRAQVPLPVLRDVIQPFPTFSEIHVAGLKALAAEIARYQVGGRIVPRAPESQCAINYPEPAASTAAPPTLVTGGVS
jgi:hypothetical protein